MQRGDREEEKTGAIREVLFDAAEAHMNQNTSHLKEKELIYLQLGYLFLYYNCVVMSADFRNIKRQKREQVAQKPEH